MEADDDDGDDDDDTSTSTKFHNIFCVRLSTYFHFHLKAFGHVGFLFASIILFVLFCFSLMTFYFVSRFYLLLFQILLCRDRDTSSLNLCSFVSEYGLAANEKENLEKTQIYFLASLRLQFFFHSCIVVNAERSKITVNSLYCDRRMNRVECNHVENGEKYCCFDFLIYPLETKMHFFCQQLSFFNYFPL